MMQLPRPSPRLARVLATGFGVALIGGVVAAQTVPAPAIEWNERRLERLERNVRKLEHALTQRNAAGVPASLLEPDPEVVALMSRVDLLDRRLGDLEATLMRVNGELETAAGDLDRASRANRDLQGRVEALTRRVAELEAAAADAAEAAAADAPAQPNSPTGTDRGDYDAAMQLMMDGDYAGARRAFEVFAVTWPESERLGEAQYRLGETRYIADDMAGAAQAYAASLRGWPRAAWAGDATVKLATALHATERGPQACQALAEFNRRYAETSPGAVRNRATALARTARCG